MCQATKSQTKRFGGQDKIASQRGNDVPNSVCVTSHEDKLQKGIQDIGHPSTLESSLELRACELVLRIAAAEWAHRGWTRSACSEDWLVQRRVCAMDDWPALNRLWPNK